MNKLLATLGLTPRETLSLQITLGLLVAMLILGAAGTYFGANLAVAVACGGIGGLVHELFQSGGKVAFFEKREDGLYLGSLSGVLLGSIAGALAAHSTVTGSIAVETFTAGLSLKGIAEAATGNVSRGAVQNIERIQSMVQAKTVQPGNIDDLLSD